MKRKLQKLGVTGYNLAEGIHKIKCESCNMS